MRIKICHIATQITGRSDGVFRHLEMLFNNMDKNKYEQILVYQGGGDVREKAERVGIKTIIVSRKP